MDILVSKREGVKKKEKEMGHEVAGISLMGERLQQTKRRDIEKERGK